MKLLLRDRKLKYSRATWTSGFRGETLEHYLISAHKLLDTTEKRTFTYNRVEIQGYDFKIDPSYGIFMHVTSYVPGQDASLVSNPAAIQHASVDTTSPPAGKDYMNGDIFFMVNNNDLVLCPSDTHEALATNYIRYMLEKSGFSTESRSFSVGKVLNYNKIKLIHDEGVKKISLNGSLFEASLDYMERKTMKKSLLHSIPHEWIELFKKDMDLKTIQEAENISVNVELSFDQRKKGGTIGKKRMEKTAAMIIEDDDYEGIKIETFSGKTITHDEIRMSKKISLTPLGNSVQCADAWKNIKDYFLDLRAAGVIQQ